MKPAILAFILIAAFSIAFAQNPSATLAGAVQDPSGALIPGVAIVARNVATNLRFSGASIAGRRCGSI